METKEAFEGRIIGLIVSQPMVEAMCIQCMGAGTLTTVTKERSPTEEESASFNTSRQVLLAKAVEWKTKVCTNCGGTGRARRHKSILGER